ncbi:MAG TPA: diguanylate cyclase [Gemmataceae bacterium]|nr:diguanylate cyclase [Gemmataceae bacterium]
MGILIVDDQPDVCNTFKVLLQAVGYEDVRTATSGRQAIRLLEASHSAVDLILTDVGMPGVSGIDLCKYVKDSPQLSDIPVLALTGLDSEEVLERVFAAGAHDFIPKNASPNKLLVRVRSALNLKRELDRRKVRERELVEVTERLRQLNEQWEKLAVIDELTGIPNRRYFNLLLKQEWGRAARDGSSLSAVVVDVDLFKKFNDAYGHPRGDECLARVAATLHDGAQRAGDTVARYGGEEFVILLPNTWADGAMTVAESLRSAVAALEIEHPGSPYGRVTISLGVASAVPEGETGPESLLASADQGLYQAKAGGRNRAMLFDGPLTPATPIPDTPFPGDLMSASDLAALSAASAGRK